LAIGEVVTRILLTSTADVDRAAARLQLLENSAKSFAQSFKTACP
jgi:hypothetical protein